MDTPTVQPEVAPVMDTPAAQPEVAPVMDTPTVQPEVAPVMDTSTVQPEVTPVMDTPTVQPEVSIYGGANPAVNVNVNNESHQIYGGADPLENTQMISTNDIQTAAAQPEAAPVAQPEVVMPQVTPIVDNQQNI